MSFKDRTFCASRNCQNECGRKMTDEERKKLNELPDYQATVSYGLFCSDITIEAKE